MEPYVYAAEITVVNVVLLMALAFRTGMARGNGEGVKVLETYTTTNEKFLIANRIHLNTLENTVTFLPLLWISTLLGFVNVAAVIGIIWLVARVAFAVLYTVNPKKRALGFIPSFFCTVALVLLNIYGLVMMVV